MSELQKLNLNQNQVIATARDGEVFKLWLNGDLIPESEYVVDGDRIRFTERGFYVDVKELFHGEP